jgi:hypothetical protein
MPLPSTTLDSSEALLYPHAHAIPADIAIFRLHVSYDEPWFFVGFPPICQQDTLDMLAFGLEESSTAIPECSRVLSIVTEFVEVMPAILTERAKSTPAHEWMPCQSSDTMEQVSGEKPAVSKDNDYHIARDTWLERLKHTNPFLVPRSSGIAFENSPCNRNGTSQQEWHIPGRAHLLPEQ